LACKDHQELARKYLRSKKLNEIRSSRLGVSHEDTEETQTTNKGATS
jgi:hypothetical protein